MRPENIQQIGDELAIKWDDGSESFVPLEKMRRNCPCASCHGDAKSSMRGVATRYPMFDAKHKTVIDLDERGEKLFGRDTRIDLEFRGPIVGLGMQF